MPVGHNGEVRIPRTQAKYANGVSLKRVVQVMQQHRDDKVNTKNIDRYDRKTDNKIHSRCRLQLTYPVHVQYLSTQFQQHTTNYTSTRIHPTNVNTGR